MSTIGLNKQFPIYNADGSSFENLVIQKATLESVVMSLGDKLTGDVYYKDTNLSVTMNEYVEVDGVHYVLVNPPTIVREGMVSENSELKGMTKYNFVFYHPMCMLGNFPFSDVAVDSQESNYLSDKKTFTWIGNLDDYIAKINANLVGTEWVCAKKSSMSQDEQQMAAKISQVLTFDNTFINEVLKKGFEEWGIPFTIKKVTSDETIYAQGKRFKIVFGFPNQEILGDGGVPYVFQFGKGVGLKNNSRNPRNNKIVTRIMGYGSENNIPFGYPQVRWYGSASAEFTYGDHAGTYTNVTIGGHTFAKLVSYPIYKGILGGQYVQLIKHPFTRKNLMPSVYVNDLFNKVSPYLSNGSVNTNYNADKVLRDYYDADTSAYPNQIDLNNPCVEIHGFEDIKPELGEKFLVDAQPYDNVAQNPLQNAIPLNSFLSQISTDLNTEYTVTNENERVALNSLYELLDEDGGERHFANMGGSYTFKCDVTKDADYYYVKYVSDNINYDVVCIQRGHTVTPTWNDDMDENGEYVQSYFKVTLPALGFDLYACASITEKMDINMRGGACIGCTFPVQVDWEDYKRNFYDENGEFSPQGQQRSYTKYPDTTSQQVTLIVQKDLDTFGTLMPNIYQQPHANDQFVILGISLPTTYVEDAQARLDSAMREYMLENNVHYFDYPLKFDEYFLATHTDLLVQIHTNSIIRFLYNGTTNVLYVKQLVVKYGEKPLPQYDITLTDDIEVVLNQIGQVTDDVSRMRVQLSELQKYYSGNLIDAINEKLSRVADDIAQGKITFQNGIDALARCVFSDELRSNIFMSGLYGGRGWRIDNLGNAELESLRVRSYLEIVELLINRIQAQEGDTIFTDNDQIERVEKVEALEGTYFILSLKEKFDGYVTCQQYGNILKGVINTMSAKEAGVSEYVDFDAVEEDSAHNTYYTSWMHVIETHNSQGSTLGVNQIKVMLYDNSETPANVNFEPCELMTIVRWGCKLNPEEPGISELEKRSRQRRQNVFMLSTSEGRIMKLTKVNTPILNSANYGTTLGLLPDFVKNWAIGQRLIDGRDYLYAQGIVVGDFIKVDINGAPIVNYVDCGEWVNGDLVPTPSIGHGIYLVNGYNPNSLQWETHDVWHNGAMWRCLVAQPYNGTYYEPTEANSAYWEKLLDSGQDGSDAVSYEVEWTDANGVITNIPCDSNGNGKVIVGYGVDTWLTASLYKRIGNDARVLCPCMRIELHVFLEDGSELLNSSFPKIVYSAQSLQVSSISVDNYEASQPTHMKYVARFFEDARNLNIESSISRTIDGANGSNGSSAPQYTLEYYAWSNVVSTASVSTSPFTEPYSGWSDSIPPQGSLAYLWKKIVLYTYNSSTNTYTANPPQYYRMNGENGTTISVKGTVLGVTKYWAHQESDLPTSGETNGTLAWIEGTNYLLEYHESSTGWWAQSVTLSNGDLIICCDPSVSNRKKIYSFVSSSNTFAATATTINDGYSYTEQFLGHLWQWSDEATNWLDLGVFKGESGKTYYTHIAWATSVTWRQTPLSPAEGCLNKRNVSSVVGGSTTPPSSNNGKPYRGYRIDEIAGSDSTQWTTYTWQYVKGEQGEKGNVGRFYYFGGDFDASNTTKQFVVNNATTPYFRHIEDGQVRYHVFNPTESVSDNLATMAQMWDMTHTDQSLTPPAKSFNMYPWEAMTNDYKYLITEAIFGDFAHFGSAIISGDWMLSTNGTINNVEYNNGAMYNGAEAYTWFDPQYPNESVNTTHTVNGNTWTGYNFVPNYSLDMKRGWTYQNVSEVKGVFKSSGDDGKSTYLGAASLLFGFRNADIFRISCEGSGTNRNVKLQIGAAESGMTHIEIESRGTFQNERTSLLKICNEESGIAVPQIVIHKGGIAMTNIGGTILKQKTWDELLS